MRKRPLKPFFYLKFYQKLKQNSLLDRSYHAESKNMHFNIIHNLCFRVAGFNDKFAFWAKNNGQKRLSWTDDMFFCRFFSMMWFDSHLREKGANFENLSFICRLQSYAMWNYLKLLKFAAALKGLKARSYIKQKHSTKHSTKHKGRESNDA